jgi:MFS transporter, UMF1 family
MNKVTMSREERAWVLYDVGNSAFVLVMVTAIMPIFYKDVAAVGMSAAESTAHWGYANSFSSLLLALAAPLLGAMADRGNRKRSFFLAFLFAGLVFTVLLAGVGPGQWLLCLALFVLARIGWAGANIFYDAFLPDVATPERRDLISTRGYAYGYIGSVIPFVAIIALLLFSGMEDGLPAGAARIGFLIVALWWLLLSLPALRHLRQRSQPSAETAGGGWSRLYQTFREVRRHRQAFLFLLAYFFYIDGVDTIITMATAYGRDLGFGVALLIVVLLVIQIVAFPCALLFGRLAQRYSARRMIFVGIAVYAVVVGIAFLLPSIKQVPLKTAVFWLLAVLVASSMGGIQALSRSYFCRLIPPGKSAEFFGFYNVFGKFAAITGPFLVGVIGQITGETRWGVLSILVLLFIGAGLLALVKEEGHK